MSTKLEDMVAIVTGSSSGLGLRASEMMCEQGMDVILACRNEEKGKRAVESIKTKNANAKATFMKLDLASLQSVKDFADAFLSTGKPLHVLVNNAGMYKTYQKSEPKDVTVDGFEIHVATNHMGHYFLTSLLLPKLKQNGTAEQKSRIVVLASSAHGNGKKRTAVLTDFDDINYEKESAKCHRQCYKDTKLANVMFTISLARMLEGENVIINSMCPGFVSDTEIFRGENKIVFTCLTKCLCRPCVWFVMNYFGGEVASLDRGAGLIVDLAINPKHNGTSGEYFRRYRVDTPSLEARDEEKQNKLWQWSKERIEDKMANVKVFA